MTTINFFATPSKNYFKDYFCFQKHYVLALSILDKFNSQIHSHPYTSFRSVLTDYSHLIRFLQLFISNQKLFLMYLNKLFQNLYNREHKVNIRSIDSAVDFRKVP